MDITINNQQEYHLIVTEGTGTEPKYFQRISGLMNESYKERVEIQIYGAGDNTLRLLKKAKKRVLASPSPFKHAWIVYDTDDFPADDIDNTALACKAISNTETTYHAIWSNQCIELWFLLHFDFFHSDLHRKDYTPKLSNYLEALSLGKYRKNRDDMFDILLPRLDTAIMNAKKLEKINLGKPPSKCRPGTKVYEMIEKLKPYLSIAEL
jgi:hypothetical protein